jgi:methyl-accepting chemotaxis protein
MVGTREPGRWSGGTRTVEDHRREYDWDGAVEPACREIVALIGHRQREIAEGFWRHFKTMPSSQPMRKIFDDPTAYEAQVAHGARYGAIKFEKPFSEEWVEMVCAYATQTYAAGIPLPAVVAAFSYAHSATMRALREALPGDAEKLGRLCDVVQRMAMADQRDDLAAARFDRTIPVIFAAMVLHRPHAAAPAAGFACNYHHVLPLRPRPWR